jgi:hypothetical protein
VVAGDALGEGDDQTDDRLDVVQLAELVRAVQIARRDREQAGRDPRSGQVDLVCVGRRRARVDLERVRDVSGLGRLREQLDDLLVQAATRAP